MECIRHAQAYNHNGQNYFEQLTTYNSMSSHLRRVLLAKCVIDSRNKNCVTRRKQFYKQIECKPHFTKRKITDDLIDRLAYDTLHHPADVVQLHYDSRYSCHDEDQRYSPDCYDHDSICPQSSLLHDHVICSRSPGFKPNKYQTIQKGNHDMGERCTRTISKDEDIRCRYTEDSIYYESISDIRTTKNNHVSVRCDEDCKAARVTDNNPTGNPQHSGKWEEAKYVNFVYEITREILHDHLYTDDQLREVFQRHIEKNKEHLNVNRMMFEIYQLKNALDIVDELGDEDIVVEQPRPPTPPKVLDENKVLEKLMSYCSDENSNRRQSTASNKSVVLVDANPEMMLTERDVLTSLIESDINPDDAQKIYRRLFSKSKEFTHGFADLVNTTARSNDSDAESVNDRLDPTFEEASDSNKANEQEKGSTTQDLITQADKDLQV
ncbi:uncharacterized protein LOC143210332 isoform X2 [Lasioglossum baleicum]|uniref:uncharacterized protein LOC143210332 isoform X2 n=1 Tax=Lasioglossum baleicum TaxID=434251 RepID=UPI003FCE9987